MFPTGWGPMQLSWIGSWALGEHLRREGGVGGFFIITVKKLTLLSLLSFFMKFTSLVNTIIEFTFVNRRDTRRFNR